MPERGCCYHPQTGWVLSESRVHATISNIVTISISVTITVTVTDTNTDTIIIGYTRTYTFNVGY